ncbi:unnamed protein product, partial [Prorocentrum cordatum]
AQLVSAAGAATGAARGRPCPWRSGTCSSRPRQLRGRSGAAAGQLRQPGRGARRAAGGSCLLVAHQLGDGVAPAREALAAGRPRAPRRGGPGGAAALQGAGGGEPGPLPPAGAGEHRLRLGPAAGEAGDPLDTGLCALGGCRGQLQRAGDKRPTRCTPWRCCARGARRRWRACAAGPRARCRSSARRAWPTRRTPSGSSRYGPPPLLGALCSHLPSRLAAFNEQESSRGST